VAKYFKDLQRIDQLNEIEHWVTQQSGTERPGTGKYLKNKNLGIYKAISVFSCLRATRYKPRNVAH
jgi:peptide methionine sulfoxide reductase MsrB